MKGSDFLPPREDGRSIPVVDLKDKVIGELKQRLALLADLMASAEKWELGGGISSFGGDDDFSVFRADQDNHKDACADGRGKVQQVPALGGTAHVFIVLGLESMSVGASAHRMGRGITYAPLWTLHA